MKFQYYFLIIYPIAFLLILTISELAYKRLRISAEYTRKISHITATLTSLSFVYVFQTHWFVLGLAVFSFLLLFIGKLKQSFRSIEDVSRRTLGSYLLPVGIYISFAISDHFNNRLLFILPILILAISDSLAGIIGLHFTGVKNHLNVLGLKVEKTLSGTMAFLVSSIFISALTFYVFGFDFPKIIGLTIYISLATTIIEFLSPFGTDNLTIPVFASAILVISL